MVANQARKVVASRPSSRTARLDDLEVEVEPGEATGDVDQDQIGIGQDAGVGQAGPQRAELAPHARIAHSGR
jgi:hypothetical protein